MNRIILNFIQLGFAFALLVWVLKSTNIEFEKIKGLMKLDFLVLIFTLVLVTVFLGHYRWWKLMMARGLQVQFWDSMRLTFIGLFFNFAIPGAVGGDVIKVYYISKNRKDLKIDAGITVLMDRLVGLMSLLFMGLVSALYFGAQKPQGIDVTPIFLIITGLIIILCLISLLILWLPRKIETWQIKQGYIKKIFDFIAATMVALAAYRNHKKEVIYAIIISFLSQLFIVGVFYLVGSNLGETIRLDIYFVAVSLGLLGSAVPISPGGIGIGQVSFYYFFKLCTDQTVQVGTLGISILQAFMFLLGLIGGLLYVRGVKSLKFSGPI